MIEFKEGIAEITLEQLQNTISLGEFDGRMPKSVPIIHHELLAELQQIATKGGLNQLMPISIKEKYCKKRKDAPNNNPEHFMVNRMAGKILFPEKFLVGDDTLNAGIAYTYVYDGSQRGIQIAYGMNVEACDNLTVWGRYSFSTTGSSSVPFEKGMELLHKWVDDRKAVNDGYVAIIEKLRLVEFDANAIDTLVGDLFTKAVLKNANENVVAPLNQSEVAEMVRKGRMNHQNEIITGWDVLNWGTLVLRPTSSDMTDYVGGNVAFADHVINFCQV
jgi:hypothetical protein